MSHELTLDETDDSLAHMQCSCGELDKTIPAEFTDNVWDRHLRLSGAWPSEKKEEGEEL